VSASEYLAFLSLKYEVDPDMFFRALVSAEENQSATCGNLSIEYRGKQRDKTVLLITKGQKVVAQFPLPKEFFAEANNPIRSARKTDMIRRHLVKTDCRSSSTTISGLRTGMKRVSLRAKVLEIARPTLVFTRFGNYASVANALIADETGTIKLCLWNEQIGSISIGDTIQIENASMSTFRGERQLRIGKKGTVSNVENFVPEQGEVSSI
jgi:replication factor A1